MKSWGVYGGNENRGFGEKAEETPKNSGKKTKAATE